MRMHCAQASKHEAEFACCVHLLFIAEVTCVSEMFETSTLVKFSSRAKPIYLFENSIESCSFLS